MSTVTLEDAVQAVADRLGHPVVVYDEALEVAAFSRHDADVDRGRVSVILARRATQLVAQRIASFGVDGLNAPTVLPGVDDLPPRVLMSLRQDHGVRGYLSFPAPGLDDAELQRFTSILMGESENLAHLLAQRHGAAVVEVFDPARLLSDLLLASDAMPALAAQIVARGLLVEGESYRVVIVRPGAIGFDAASALLAQAKLAVLGAAIGQDYVVVAAEGEMSRVRELVQDSRSMMHTGEGGAVPLASAHESYRQAQVAVEAALRLPYLHGMRAAWDTLGVDQLLIPWAQAKPIVDLPRGVEQMLDLAVNFDVPRTVECYLRHGADSHAAAAELDIHRSTLYYRLDRVKELTGVDLESSVVRREFMIGLHLARVMGRWS